MSARRRSWHRRQRSCATPAAPLRRQPAAPLRRPASCGGASIEPIQGGDDDGEAHARALGAEGAPAPLRRAATLPRSPSHAPLLTWTQGPRRLALPLRRSRVRRAATGRGGLPRAPLPAPRPVSLVNGGYGVALRGRWSASCSYPLLSAGADAAPACPDS
jgi:hypothetical protein